MNKNDLPVQILNNELPKDNTKYHKMFTEEQTSKSNSGFVNALFLGTIMVVSFLWGMLAIILKGVQ